MKTRISALLALAVAITAAAIVGLGSGGSADARGHATVDVQLLSFNDFHGNLEPPTGSNGRIGATDAGGIEYFSTQLQELKAPNPNTLIVGAGDMIGASPLLSALFHDEPTIEGLNAAGLQVTSVGNHEFDEGWPELYRMQKGGCHPTDGCQDKTPFGGAKFQYLSANVFLNPQVADKANLAKIGFKATDKRPHPLLPPYTIKTIGGVKIGFIGMTLENTPLIVTPTGVQGLNFYPEAYMANYWAQNLRKKGVRTIVVLLHEGGFQTGTYNECKGISGPIVQIADLMSNDIDVIVSGHTHQAYNCMFGSKLVTSASSFGRLITDINLTIDTTTGKVVSKAARNVIVTRNVAKDPAETAILDHYRPFYAPLANRVVGPISSDIVRTANAAGESPLGDVIADAQLEATKDANKGSAVIAFMNPGGIRADLTASQISGGEQPGQVTYSESFTVQPFSNVLTVKTMTGDMIKRLLEQQFDQPGPGQIRLLQVSNGFTYSYDFSKPKGSRVDVSTIKLNGTLVSPATQYRVAMNNFLAEGGDGFSVFKEGTSPLGGDVDVDAFTAYLGKHAPVAPGPANRVTRTG